MIPPRRRGALLLRLLHITWALLGLGVSVVLVVTGGGHPPPIIFLPVVMAVWLAGHLALLGAGWLAGDPSAAPLSAARVLAVIGCSAVTLLGLVQAVVTAVTGELFPFLGTLWVTTMAAWTMHAVCLAGLLQRRSWAAPAAAALSFGWSGLLIWQIADHARYGRSIDPLETLLAVGIIASTVALGVALLRSPRTEVSMERNRP